MLDYVRVALMELNRTYCVPANEDFDAEMVKGREQICGLGVEVQCWDAITCSQLFMLKSVTDTVPFASIEHSVCGTRNYGTW